MSYSHAESLIKLWLHTHPDLPFTKGGDGLWSNGQSCRRYSSRTVNNLIAKGKVVVTGTDEDGRPAQIGKPPDSFLA